jgi:hypothetical protein
MVSIFAYVPISMFEDLSEAARLALGSWCHIGGSTQASHTVVFRSGELGFVCLERRP